MTAPTLTDVYGSLIKTYYDKNGYGNKDIEFYVSAGQYEPAIASTRYVVTAVTSEEKLQTVYWITDLDSSSLTNAGLVELHRGRMSNSVRILEEEVISGHKMAEAAARDARIEHRYAAQIVRNRG